METLQSLYMLRKDEREDEKKLLSYNFSDFSNQKRYINNLLSNSLVRDAWVFFYYDEIPYINSGITIIYPISQVLLQTVISNETLIRLKKTTTVGLFECSLHAAVSVTVCLMKVYEEIVQTLDDTTKQLIVDTYEMDTELFFDGKQRDYETYPSELVIAQAKVVRLFTNYFQENDVLIEQEVEEVVRYIKSINYEEKKI